MSASATVATTAAEKQHVYITDFEARLNEKVQTLDGEGKQTEMLLWDALQGAAEAVTTLQGRVKTLITEHGSMEAALFDTQRISLNDQIKILENLAMKTSKLAAFFEEKMPSFTLSASFSKQYTVISTDSVKAQYEARSAAIQTANRRFNSLLNERKSMLSGLVTGNYLRDDLEVLDGLIKA